MNIANTTIESRFLRLAAGLRVPEARAREILAAEADGVSASGLSAAVERAMAKMRAEAPPAPEKKSASLSVLTGAKG